MSYTQTVIATLFLLIFLLVTLGFNEGVYSSVDLNVRFASGHLKDCRFLDDNYTVSDFTKEDDIAREFLYGGFSARGGAISAIVLSIGVFVLAIVVPKLDLDMSAAKYKNGSWLHQGDTLTFVIGVLYQLFISASVLSVLILSSCTIMALSKQCYVPSIGIDFGVEDYNPRKLPGACSELSDNIVRRTDYLKASLFFSLASLIAIRFMDYAVRYDKKASV